LPLYASKGRLIEPLIVIGVRASKNPAGDLNEDASFELSAMPKEFLCFTQDTMKKDFCTPV